MRTTIFSLVACAAIVSATKCDIAEIAAGTLCGCSKALATCLESADLSSTAAIKQCYVEAGCSDADAAIGATSLAQVCKADWVEIDREDLRKRQLDTTDTGATTTRGPARLTPTTATPKAPATTSVAPTFTSVRRTTTTPTPTTETTTSDPTTSDTSTSTSDSTTSTSSDSSTSTGTTSAASATTTGPLVCSTTKTVSTTMCSISAGRTIACTPTTTAIASCAPGLICFKPVNNVDTCMRRDNSLTTSGLIVAIAFGVGIVASIIAVIAIYFRNKAQLKRNEQVAAMMKGSRVPTRPMESRVPAANQSEDNLPLIAPGGIRSDQQYYSEGRQEYDGGYQSQGQTQEMRGGAPRLHQGLAALGGEPSPRY